MSEELKMEMTVADIEKQIDDIELLRKLLNGEGNLSQKERESCRYYLALYIQKLRSARVIV